MIVIQAGINLSYSAILLPQLNQTTSIIQINKSEATWIASLVTICLPIGSFIAGPLMDKFGRRSVALCTCIPFIFSWILMYFAKDVRLIYLARIVAGIGAGLYYNLKVHTLLLTVKIYFKVFVCQKPLQLKIDIK